MNTYLRRSAAKIVNSKFFNCTKQRGNSQGVWDYVEVTHARST